MSILSHTNSSTNKKATIWPELKNYEIEHKQVEVEEISLQNELKEKLQTNIW